MKSYREEEIRIAAMTFAYNKAGRNSERILSAGTVSGYNPPEL